MEDRGIFFRRLEKHKRGALSLKKVEKDELGNGRSLSLASVFGKILESPTKESVCKHPEDNAAVSNNLH